MEKIDSAYKDLLTDRPLFPQEKEEYAGKYLLSSRASAAIALCKYRIVSFCFCDKGSG